MDLQKLWDELATDPLSRGYPSMTDEQAAESLNDVIDRPHNRTSMTGREVAAEIVNAEYDELTEPKKSQILALIASNDIDPFGFAANAIKGIFGTGSATLASLATIRIEAVSRAVELNLGPVRAGDVQRARG